MQLQLQTQLQALLGFSPTLSAAEPNPILGKGDPDPALTDYLPPWPGESAADRESHLLRFPFLTELPAVSAPREMSRFGATFYPGGVDDYYMPEVVAPAPQRFVPRPSLISNI